MSHRSEYTANTHMQSNWATAMPTRRRNTTYAQRRTYAMWARVALVVLTIAVALVQAQ